MFADGSLNLILRRPIVFRASTALALGEGKWRFWPASVSGDTVWIYRWVGQPRHVVELVAERHLRSTMHLRDGDELRILIDAAHVAHMPILERFEWAVRWSGRKDWYYTRDSYVRRVVRVSRRGLAIRNGFINGLRTVRSAATRLVPWAGKPETSDSILRDGTDEPPSRLVD